MMLGARKEKIGRLMLIETIVVGVCSLVIGTVLGVLLSVVVGHLMSNILEIELSGYYPLYWPAVLFTCLFFGVLFLISAVWNRLRLARRQVLQLLNGNMQADRPARGGAARVLMTIAGCISLGIGYFCLVFMEQLRELGLLTATVMTPLGTYLLFMALLPALLDRLKKNEKRMLRGMKSFTFGQLSFRIHGLTKMLATVAMLIALGAGAIAGGLAFMNNALVAAESSSVYDTQVHNPNQEQLRLLNSITFTERLEYHYKVDHEMLYFVQEELESQRPLIKEEYNSKSWNRLIRIQGPPPAGSSWNGDYSPDPQWNQFLLDMTPNDQPYGEYRVVNKQQFEELASKEQRIVLGKTADFLSYKAKWRELDRLEQEKLDAAQSNWTVYSKFSIYENYLGIASGTVFMGFFLGIAFLTMMASCLMFKILTGAAKDIQRYQMLRKIGVRRERLAGSIRHELLLVFLFPGLAGLSHVLVGMNLFSFILVEPYYRIWVPVAIFTMIYSVYYLITVNLYQRIVLPGKE